MSVRSLVLGCFLSVFSPRSREPLGEWMAKNIIVQPEENPSKPGPYDPDYSPAIAKLLDLFFDSTEWGELILQKSGQSAASFHSLGHIVRMIAGQPANCLYVMDSDTQAKKISERLQAFLRHSPATEKLFAECETGIATFSYSLPGMNLWLTGAGSAGKLASVTVMLGVADEVDKHKALSGEATTLDLLRTRLKEQTGSRLVAFSTPTFVHGQIHREYLTGSRHKYHVPCPHPECGHLQHLVWKQMRFAHCKDLIGNHWDLNRVLRETYYECEACKGEIFDHHKRGMMKLGTWRPTNFRIVSRDGVDVSEPAWEPGKLSAHYSDLYSQNQNVSFGQLAKKFIAAQQDPMKLRDFNQNNMGEPDQETIGEVTEDKLLSLRGAYRRQQQDENRGLGELRMEGEVFDPGTPISVKGLMAALIGDTQDENSKWSIQVFDRKGDQYFIDWGSSLELSDLDEIGNREVMTAAGPLPISVVMIDEGGHRTFEVRQHVKARSGGFPACFSSRGAPGSVGSMVSLKDYRVFKDDPNSPTIPVVTYDDNVFKRELYIRSIANFDAKKAEAYGHSRLWFPANVEPEFLQEFMREKLVRTKTGRFEWTKQKGNDWGDTAKMGKILWAWLGPELIRLADEEAAAAAAEVAA